MNKSNYLSVYPAPVRYDTNLSDGAFRLYGEITAAADTEGECDEDIDYFAELLDRSPRTMYRYVVELAEKGYIQREEREGKKYLKLPREMVVLQVEAIKEEKQEPVKQEFFDRFMDTWNTTVGAKQKKIEQYKRMLNARLKNWSEEELLLAIEGRKRMMDGHDFFKQNPHHRRRVELLIRDDKRVADALDFMEKQEGERKDLGKETIGFNFAD